MEVFQHFYKNLKEINLLNLVIKNDKFKNEGPKFKQ